MTWLRAAVRDLDPGYFALVFPVGLYGVPSRELGTVLPAPRLALAWALPRLRRAGQPDGFG